MSELRITVTRPEFWIKVFDNGDQRQGQAVVPADIAGYKIRLSFQGPAGNYTELDDKPSNENGNLVDVVILPNANRQIFHFQWAAIDINGNVGEFTPPFELDARASTPQEPAVVSRHLGVPSGMVRFVE